MVCFALLLFIRMQGVNYKHGSRLIHESVLQSAQQQATYMLFYLHEPLL